MEAFLMMQSCNAGYNTLPAEANDTAHRLLQPVGPDGGLGVQVIMRAPFGESEQFAALHLYLCLA